MKKSIIVIAFVLSVICLSSGQSKLLLKGFRASKLPKKSYKQYLGYIKENEKFLLVHVMKYKCKKQFKKDFPEWNRIFSILLNEPDNPQLSYLLQINLDKKLIEAY